MSLSFEQSGYGVTETDASQTISVCVIVRNLPLRRDGIVANVHSFEFTGEAMGMKKQNKSG